jgi:tetratricopeptide (TPR) repeat protein
MKKVLLSISLLAFTSLIFAQNQQYMQAMGQNLQLFSTAQSVQDWQNIANQFERIASVEKNEWLPLYYAAQATVFMSFAETDKSKIDAYLDAAQKFLDNAFKLKTDESELHVLQGMLHQGRISVDFMGRGMKYSQLAAECFVKARELNPENPRSYYLEALSVLNTPEMYGGGKTNALPLFKQAKEKFDKFEASFPLAPDWGKEHNEQQIELCQK